MTAPVSPPLALAARGPHARTPERQSAAVGSDTPPRPASGDGRRSSWPSPRAECPAAAGTISATQVAQGLVLHLDSFMADLHVRDVPRAQGGSGLPRLTREERGRSAVPRRGSHPVQLDGRSQSSGRGRMSDVRMSRSPRHPSSRPPDDLTFAARRSRGGPRRGEPRGLTNYRRGRFTTAAPWMRRRSSTPGGLRR
jgi:hypothetical protein